jgi:hypothetical protein
VSELILRPGRNDHLVLDNLLTDAHGVRRLRPLVAGMVLDAQVACAQPEFARIAQASGTSLLVDPLTFLLQSEVNSADRWAHLPFARIAALTPSDLNDPAAQRNLVELVVAFQLTQAATAVSRSGPRDLRVELEESGDHGPLAASTADPLESLA